jgi:hypothetical protein
VSPMLLPKLALILGVVALTLALRSYSHPVLQKLGAVGIMVSSYLAGFFLTGSKVAGAVAAASWLLLPWLDLVTRIRKLTLPLDKKLRQRAPPGAQVFPALPELTEEIEEHGFEHLTDSGWDWEEYQQFFRLFYKGDERLQAAVCLVDQQDIAFYYLSLSSRAKDGTIWTTWNYPFSYSLKLAPQWRVNRLRGDLSFFELYDGHRTFLSRNGVTPDLLEELDCERVQAEVQKDLRAQVAHNLATGVLLPAGESEVRYSWRGLLYLWVQFLRDLVRFT